MIKSKSFYSLMMIFAFTGSLAAQECVYPALIEIPNGEIASIEDMVSAQGSIQQFVTDMTAYQDCINTSIEVAGADATDEFKAIMIGRFNAAATEIEAVAAAFNEQIAAFRAANP
jgi:HAMP domain-containing protein